MFLDSSSAVPIFYRLFQDPARPGARCAQWRELSVFDGISFFFEKVTLVN